MNEIEQLKAIRYKILYKRIMGMYVVDPYQYYVPLHEVFNILDEVIEKKEEIAKQCQE